MSVLEYTHKVHPRAKRMTLKVSDSGEVVVVTPRFTPAWSIKQFVESHTSWIARRLLEVSHQQEVKNSNTTLLFGKEYQLKLVQTADVAAGVHIKGTHIVVNSSELLTKMTWRDSHTQQLNRFLKRTARVYIEPRTRQISEIMNIEYFQLRLKEQKSRWGSCSSDGNLNFNWRLVHCPPEVIDYVIIHELAHRKHMDHSSRFWSLVAQYSPDHRLHRGWLKRQGRFLI